MRTKKKYEKRNFIFSLFISQFMDCCKRKRKSTKTFYGWQTIQQQQQQQQQNHILYLKCRQYNVAQKHYRWWKQIFRDRIWKMRFLIISCSVNSSSMWAFKKKKKLIVKASKSTHSTYQFHMHIIFPRHKKNVFYFHKAHAHRNTEMIKRQNYQLWIRYTE